MIKHLIMLGTIVGALLSTSASAHADPIPFNADTCKSFHGFAAVVNGERVCMTGPQHHGYHGPQARPAPSPDDQKYPDGIMPGTKRT